MVPVGRPLESREDVGVRECRVAEVDRSPGAGVELSRRSEVEQQDPEAGARLGFGEVAAARVGVGAERGRRRSVDVPGRHRRRRRGGGRRKRREPGDERREQERRAPHQRVPDRDSRLLGSGERCDRFLRPRIALSLRPHTGLAHELTQLGEERRHTGTLTLERLDPLQPGQHCARLLHAPKVGGNS